MSTRTKQYFSGFSNVGAGFSRMVDGFSLVELVIVIVIVGLSSAIAVPIVSINDTKAKLSEADAAMTSLRTQLRIYEEKNGEYPIEASAINVIGADWNNFSTNALNGKYFADGSYTYESLDGMNFTLSCAGGSVLDSERTLNQSGVFNGGN
ncbi:MAG: prepilin-type N-terminal cleavage/methylation domain-containing protein [FCB group bacterium]|nr:prepilin-type N-terminal cleavage/methylation domain-containing protein [FCB group bacterium]MBL7120964.1 prepilin-type N-terminal cleavage/methylation domain-containing protein [Candidatus Neomarinimicrobiota bacterium]